MRLTEKNEMSKVRCAAGCLKNILFLYKRSPQEFRTVYQRTKTVRVYLVTVVVVFFAVE
mgnify:FL=1